MVALKGESLGLDAGGCGGLFEVVEVCELSTRKVTFLRWLTDPVSSTSYPLNDFKKYRND